MREAETTVVAAFVASAGGWEAERAVVVVFAASRGLASAWEAETAVVVAFAASHRAWHLLER